MTSPPPASPFGPPSGPGAITGPPSARPPIDPLIADRLARLQQRTVGRYAGSRTAAPAQRGAPAATASAGGSSQAPRSPQQRSTRRRHAARKSRVAALLLSCATTGSLAALLGYVDHANASASATAGSTSANASAGATPVTVAPAPSASTSAAAASVDPSASPSASPSVSASVSPAGVTAETQSTTTGSPTSAAATTPAATRQTAPSAGGTFVGDVEANRYGNVQVQITVSSGIITASTAVQTPANDRKSVSINNRAVPTLDTETTTAQSAAIQGVSGATYTSDGYEQSLQSAIDQAVAAGALAAS